MKRLMTILLLLLAISSIGQTADSNEFTYNEFLGYVRKFHPLVRSANLRLSNAQANLMAARGAFDPKIEVDFEQKKFKDKEYYSLLNSSFKIPTWYGIEVKAGFDDNSGYYLNPENTVPGQGLASMGIKVPLGQGLLTNPRMADLQKAKIQVKLSEAERKLEAVQVLYDASVAYFNWKRSYAEAKLYEQYLANARLRHQGMIQLIVAGDKPAIDSVETGMALRNRLLSLSDAQLKLAKARLALSDFLWLDNNIPMELKENLFPEERLTQTISETLRTAGLFQSQFSLEAHPKISGLQNKIDLLEIDRRLKANSLLPKLDLGYYYLSVPKEFGDARFDDYKVAVNFSFPIFLRKERGGLLQAKYKLEASRNDLAVERLQLRNKLAAQQTEIESLSKQLEIAGALVGDNQTMLTSEDKLFSFGESSVFLINTRENNLISAQLARLAMEFRLLESNAAYYRTLADPQ